MGVGAFHLRVSTLSPSTPPLSYVKIYYDLSSLQFTFRFGLPPDRLWVSVYEDDDEAFQLWSDEVSYKWFSSTIILFAYIINFYFD